MTSTCPPLPTMTGSLISQEHTRLLLILVVPLLFCVGACGPEHTDDARGQSGSAFARKPYHVVLLVIDTLRPDGLSVEVETSAGRISTSPNFDRLSAESVRFDLALAPATWTRPSMASLMTSTWPSEHGMLDLKDEEGKVPEILDEKFVTLAEGFQGAGWQTVGLVNQVYLQYQYGFGQGFEQYEGRRGRSAFQLLERLQAWFDEVRDAKRSFFAYVHVLDPHWRYHRRLKSLPRDAFGPADRRLNEPHNGSLLQAWAEEHLDDDGVTTLRARYLHEIAWVDEALGVLVTKLKQRGVWDNTVLVVTSDHGESFWEHGRLLHGTDPYDELLRVPLLIRLPPGTGLTPRRIDAPVSLLDVLPTVLDLVGAPIPADARGQSLLPLLAGEPADADAIAFFDCEAGRGVRSRTSKLFVRNDGTTEFYRIGEDPLEQVNRSADCGRDCRSLGIALRRFVEGLRPIVAEAQSVAPDDEERAEIEALGYLGH